MDERDWLARRFQGHRPRLRAVAYRMLGSLSDADDAVQGAWLRLARADVGAVANLGGWLTTVVARESLDLLRARGSRREELLPERLPDPVVGRWGAAGREEDPEAEALLAEGIGLAMLVVLDTLTPAERLAFVLHDTFGVPFAEIGRLLGRSTAAAKMLASRARRRVRGAAADAEPDPSRQREVVEAFYAAARQGRFEDLVALLDPGAVVRADSGRSAGVEVVRGAPEVARRVVESGGFGHPALTPRRALVNGTAGLVLVTAGRAVAVLGFTVRRGRVAEVDIFADPQRLRRLDMAVLDEP
ncbi:RNA polymerase subunit sigma-70 [Mangrovactinospora gilvigrisea]|uniref:RNA polymerase subunit sigma-70 n=1 Tax=Mangrovactinospora gilvigrisea TaxID=1428644 RepID=A0A1J7BL45_9ACTN|nr:sigma-70 family RNA polymerase sigma factor [Mangrovactinospora gilvigrisea]OIV39427.1 RNA polymerase subunit sigma-70 [Mangrovactinospora gilvigrisea]